MKNTRNVKVKHFRGTPGRFKQSPLETYTKVERQEAADELRALWQAEIQRAEDLRVQPLRMKSKDDEAFEPLPLWMHLVAIALGVALGLGMVYGVAYLLVFLASAL